MDFISRTHRTPQIDMHYAAVGDPSKPLVICLHGFPEFWVAWRGVMEALSDRYYLVAPDQRGVEWVKWITHLRLNRTSKIWQLPLPLE